MVSFREGHGNLMDRGKKILDYSSFFFEETDSKQLKWENGGGEVGRWKGKVGRDGRNVVYIVSMFGEWRYFGHACPATGFCLPV